MKGRSLEPLSRIVEPLNKTPLSLDRVNAIEFGGIVGNPCDPVVVGVAHKDVEPDCKSWGGGVNMLEMSM